MLFKRHFELRAWLALSLSAAALSGCGVGELLTSDCLPGALRGSECQEVPDREYVEAKETREADSEPVLVPVDAEVIGPGADPGEGGADPGEVEPGEETPPFGFDPFEGAYASCLGGAGEPLPLGTACLVPDACGEPGKCDGAGDCRAPNACADARFPTCDADTCRCEPGSCDAGYACSLPAGACTGEVEVAVVRVEDDAIQQVDASLSYGDLEQNRERFDIGPGHVAWFRFDGVHVPADATIDDARLLLFNPRKADELGRSFKVRLQLELAADAGELDGVEPQLREAWTTARTWEHGSPGESWMESPALSAALEAVRAEGGLADPLGSAVLVRMEPELTPFTAFGPNGVRVLSSTGSHAACADLGCAPRLVASYHLAWAP